MEGGAMNPFVEYAEVEDQQQPSIAFDDSMIRREIMETMAETLPPGIVPVEDPDVALARIDRSEAFMSGQPVDSDTYPKGTWFYFGSEETGVRPPGHVGLSRVEKRQ